MTPHLASSHRRRPANDSLQPPPASAGQTGLFRGWQGLLWTILVWGIAAQIAILVLCGMADSNYFADLITNFRSQYLWGGTLLAVFALLLRRPVLLAVVLALSFAHARAVLPFYLASPPFSEPGNGAPVCRLVSLNLLHQNQEHDAVVSFLIRSQADLIVVTECTEQWQAVLLSGLKASHPYSSVDVYPQWIGTRVFSRTPLQAATDRPHFRTIPDAEKLMAVTTIWDNRSIVVAAIHASSPINESRFRDRNDFLALIGNVSEQVVDPLVVAGDFNCTSASPYFQAMLQRSALRDSRIGFGWQPSWPAWLVPALRIPIDHVLINEHWRVRQREIGPAVGSDHLPVIVELQLFQQTL
jgi:endonuclease/exonuclease/phosphatase (EEP) superfamily protein YafD